MVNLQTEMAIDGTAPWHSVLTHHGSIAGGRGTRNRWEVNAAWRPVVACLISFVWR
jgi:hypothetical protein